MKNIERKIIVGYESSIDKYLDAIKSARQDGWNLMSEKYITVRRDKSPGLGFEEVGFIAALEKLVVT